MGINVRGSIDLARQFLPHTVKVEPVGEDGRGGNCACFEFGYVSIQSAIYYVGVLTSYTVSMDNRDRCLMQDPKEL